MFYRIIKPCSFHQSLLPVGYLIAEGDMPAHEAAKLVKAGVAEEVKEPSLAVVAKTLEPKNHEKLES